MGPSVDLRRREARLFFEQWPNLDHSSPIQAMDYVSPHESGRRRIHGAVHGGYPIRSDPVPQRYDLLRAGDLPPVDRKISPIPGGWGLAGSGGVRIRCGEL